MAQLIYCLVKIQTSDFYLDVMVLGKTSCLKDVYCWKY